jgi:hypothetical protein
MTIARADLGDLGAQLVFEGGEFGVKGMFGNAGFGRSV